LKEGKSQKIRTLPTRPLHAVLDELLAIGITIWIIVSICRVIISCGKRIDETGDHVKAKEGNERGKNIEQAESTHPADGQNAQTDNQAKAFFHEVSKPRRA